MGSKFCSRVVRPVASGQLSQLVAASRGSGQTLFVKFASAFCAACQESRKAMDAAMQKTQKCLNVVELDSDVADSTADQFKVKALPTLVAIRNGEVVGKVEGVQESVGYQRFFEKHSEG